MLSHLGERRVARGDSVPARGDGEWSATTKERGTLAEPLLFELSRPGRKGVPVPASDVPEQALPAEWCRESLPLPEVAERDVVKHFTRLSQRNYAIDLGLYPLGSCTMKYNPRINEDAARQAGFAMIHPSQPAETVQGALELLYELQGYLAEISGFDAVTLQPAA